MDCLKILRILSPSAAPAWCVTEEKTAIQISTRKKKNLSTNSAASKNVESVSPGRDNQTGRGRQVDPGVQI